MQKQHSQQDLVAAAKASGGTLILETSFPSPGAFKRKMDAYAPGCGTPIRVIGTTAGTVPCGAKLHLPGGKVDVQFCHYCEQTQEALKHPVAIKRHLDSAAIRTRLFRSPDSCAVVDQRHHDRLLVTLSPRAQSPTVSYDEATGEVTVKFKL